MIKNDQNLQPPPSISKDKPQTKSNNLRTVTPKLILPDHILNSKLNPNGKYKTNQIHTSKYTWITFLPKNLFEQFYRFANLYFLLIQILNWLPGMEVFIKEVQLMPLLFVLSVTAIKDLFEDRRRHQSDKRVNNLSCRRYDKKLNRFVRTKWKNIVVGDLIHLSCDEILPADILLLKSKSVDLNEDGVCYVETANLDGENNLKPRFVVPNVAEPNEEIENINFDFVVECEKPNMKLHKFQGCIKYSDPKKRKIAINKDNLLLRDCKLKNTSYVEGLVIYAGHETKAMLNNKGPRLKRSRLEKMMNRDIIMCVVILIIMCIISFMGRYLWLDQFVSINNASVPFTSEPNPVEALDFTWPLRTVCTFAILYQMIIPISLYVCIEMVKLGQIYMINRDDDLYDPVIKKRCECRAWNITEDLGQVEYMFCDKTGTLTENVMKFRCCSVNGLSYEHDSPSTMAESYQQSVSQQTPEINLNDDLKRKILDLTQKYQKWFNENTKQSDGDDNEKGEIKTEIQKLELSSEEQRIHDFFIVLTICNTANSPVTHEDKLNVKGQLKFVLETEKSLTSKTSSQTKNSSSTSYSFDFLNVFHQTVPRSTTDDEKEKNLKDNVGIPKFESESPDEVALVSAAYQYQYRLLKRGRDWVLIKFPNGSIVKYKVLQILPFDSDRKRMSVIVECPFTGQIVLYSKGSDQTILAKLQNDPENHLELVKKHLLDYSNLGLRVLCTAKRILDPNEYLKLKENLIKAECSEKREKQLRRLYNRIESDLKLLGATAIEDKLQYRVPEIIRSLRQAGIVIWVLTGDKMETAISIAKSCSLFTGSMKLMTISLDNVKSKKTAWQDLCLKLDMVKSSCSDISNLNSSINTNESFQQISGLKRKSSGLRLLEKVYMFLNRGNNNSNDFDTKFYRPEQWGLVIDSASLNFVLQKDNLKQFVELTQYCSSVLCCRVTPSQKAYVVKCVKNKMNALTMAVGDGANDVAMIQTAHLGVGIIGKEGTQAAMASDFAVPKFHFLERLILVHGNLCYNRLALTILYFFYKNSLVVFVLFFYQFLSGFSGASLLDDIYLMAVNIFYTTIPAIVRGILEKDCDESVFLTYPQLYDRGRKSRVYTYRSFWVNTMDSIYQSAVIFFMCYSIFQNTSASIHEFGLAVFFVVVETNLLMICMENKYWTLYFVYSIYLSIGFFLSTVVFLDFNYSTSLISVMSGRNYKLFLNLTFNLGFFIAITLVPIICLIPRFTLRALQEIIKPQFEIPKKPIQPQQKEQFD